MSATRCSTCSRCSASTRRSAQGDYADLDADTVREMLGEMARLAEGPLADSFVDGDRNPPVFDPETHTVTLPESFKKSVRPSSTAAGTRSASTRSSAACRCPRRWSWALARARARRQPGGLDVRRRRRLRPDPVYHLGTEEQKKWAVLGRRARLGLDHGADRAGRRLRRRRRPHQGRQAGRRLLAHRRREAVHHLRRLRRPVREHHAPGAGPPRGRRPGHQGSVAVHRAEVPLRPRDRRARRAQRRLRHQRRAQDGPEGLGHLRADLRPARRPGQGLAGRRGARRHRADVRRHRAGPNDGGHQGDRHAVDRLPQRAGVRQGRACRVPT